MRTLIIAALALGMLPLWHKPEAVSLNYTVPELPFEVRRDNDCIPFAVYTIMSNSGRNPNLDVYNRLLDKIPAGGGTLDQAMDVMWAYGPSIAHTDGTCQELQEHLRAGKPAVVIMHASHESVGLHAMVATGFSDTEWQVADARGVFWLSDSMFSTLWSGQWIEASRRQ